MVKHFILIIIFGLLLASPLQAQDYSLEVQPKVGTLDDIFQMKISIKGAPTQFPVIKGAEDFEVNFVGPQQSIQILNGTISQQTVYVYTLLPKKTGKLLSPTVVLKNNSGFVTLEGQIIDVKKRSAEAGSDFVKLSRWTNLSEAFIGEQILSTLTLYQRVNLNEIQLEEGDYDGFWVEQIGTKKRFPAKLAGHQAEATGFTRVLFPLRTGDLQLIPAVLNAKMTLSRRSSFGQGFGFGIDPFDEIFGRVEVKKISARSKVIDLKIKALPLAPQGMPNLDPLNPIVGKTIINLKHDSKPVDYGKGKKIIYEVVSFGNLNPLDKLPIPNSKQFKVYFDNPYISNEISGDKVKFTKHFPVTIIPLRGGVVKVPAVKLSYFDPEKEIYETAISKEVEISVLGGFQSSITEEVQDIKSDKKPTEALSEEVPLWKEKSFFEKYVKSVHPLTALLYSLLICCIILLILAILRLGIIRSKRNRVLASFNSVTNISDLAAAYKTAISRLFKLSNDYTRDDLKAMINSSGLPVDSRMALLLLHDQIIHSMTNNSSNSIELRQVKDQAMKIFSSLPFSR